MVCRQVAYFTSIANTTTATPNTPTIRDALAQTHGPLQSLILESGVKTEKEE